MPFSNNHHEIRQRARAFALRVFRLAEIMPAGVERRSICQQLELHSCEMESRFRTAFQASSRRAHLACLALALEEADETVDCLELITRDRLLPADSAATLLAEARQLRTYLSAYYHSARMQS
ncbi:MAG: four helix bundle protein [Verrucomicrobiales bacterium]